MVSGFFFRILLILKADAALGIHRTGDAVQQGCLARAVGPDEGHHLPLAYLETDGMQGLNAAVFGYQIFNFQHCRRLLPGRPG